MARVRKALLAAVGAFVTAVVATYAQNGQLPGWAGLGAAVGVALAAGWAVWQVKNAPAA